MPHSNSRWARRGCVPCRPDGEEVFLSWPHMQLLREPLLHFAVAGAILFAGYSWLNNTQADTTAIEPVRIGEGDVRWLKQTWSSQWVREPSP